MLRFSSIAKPQRSMSLDSTLILELFSLTTKIKPDSLQPNSLIDKNQHDFGA